MSGRKQSISRYPPYCQSFDLGESNLSTALEQYLWLLCHQRSMLLCQNPASSKNGPVHCPQTICSPTEADCSQPPPILPLLLLPASLAEAMHVQTIQPTARKRRRPELICRWTRIFSELLQGYPLFQHSYICKFFKGCSKICSYRHFSQQDSFCRHIICM